MGPSTGPSMGPSWPLIGKPFALVSCKVFLRREVCSRNGSMAGEAHQARIGAADSCIYYVLLPETPLKSAFSTLTFIRCCVAK